MTGGFKPFTVNNEDSIDNISQCNLFWIYNHTIMLPFLQANVMLEYSIEEAEALLSKNLNTAQKSLTEIEEDLGFLRDQYTTTEVSIL